MRYGSPSIGDGIADLTAKGCRHILLFALYPQYSATTTASAYDAAFRGARTHALAAGGPDGGTVSR